MSSDQSAPGIPGIKAAYAAIDKVFIDTPLFSVSQADEALGCKLHVKIETLNPIRNFKGRGTEWFLQSMPASEVPLVAASAGNFGQGLAYAAAKRGRKLTMFAAKSANPLKVAAMRRLGADVILDGNDFDAAKAAASRYAEQNGFIYVEDGAHAAIAEGAGTIALELTRELNRRGKTLDVMLLSLGNGALLTGIGAWMKSEMPHCKIIGVVAETSPAMRLSWQEGRVICTEAAPTIADGIAVREPVPYALSCMQDVVDDVWTVSEISIRHAMRFCHRQYGLVIEPAGSVGIAAVLEHEGDVAGKSVATVLCGGNLTEGQIAEYLG